METESIRLIGRIGERTRSMTTNRIRFLSGR